VVSIDIEGADTEMDLASVSDRIEAFGGSSTVEASPGLAWGSQSSCVMFHTFGDLPPQAFVELMQRAYRTNQLHHRTGEARTKPRHACGL
ncbi:MAG: hypothetical protein AAF405_05130, partial [Pseudomonadota bacterium]